MNDAGGILKYFDNATLESMLRTCLISKNWDLALATVQELARRPKFDTSTKVLIDKIARLIAAMPGHELGQRQVFRRIIEADLDEYEKHFWRPKTK